MLQGGEHRQRAKVVLSWALASAAATEGWRLDHGGDLGLSPAPRGCRLSSGRGMRPVQASRAVLSTSERDLVDISQHSGASRSSGADRRTVASDLRMRALQQQNRTR